MTHVLSGKLKLNRRSVLIAVASVILLAAIITGFVFYGPISCYFVGYTDFEKVDDRVYIQPHLGDAEKEALHTKVQKAKQRVELLFGSVISEPVIIAGKDNQQLKKFGLPETKKSGLTYKSLIGNFIVIAEDGMNEDVIAHEMAHAELAARVGWFRGFGIPIWFDDGVATQVDFRPQYSEEVWEQRTNHGENVPDLKTLETNEQFYTEDLDTRRFHYTVARHELGRWLGKVKQAGLLDLIERLKNGESFYPAYQQVENANQ